MGASGGDTSGARAGRATEGRRFRVGYFGPEGTFTQEALLSLPLPEDAQPFPLPTIHDTVLAVAEGEADRALVPIENSVEGSVNATLDTLAIETEAVAILGELVHPVGHCLVAGRRLAADAIEAVVSHPQASAQCARFLRTRLPGARVLADTSTAAAVRTVVDDERPWAAIGNRLAAERYGGVVLESGIEDVPGNETRFAWLGPVGAPPGLPGRGEGLDPAPAPPDAAADWKTAIVFWGVGAESPGWLVACLSEFARQGVNLTRIESRPRRQGLGRYMFFADLEGQATAPRVADSLRQLRRHVDVLRVLGSFPAAGG